ncbi:MAG: C25 family cysteine peptidase, partial [Candidatus Cloacimonadaceae bacterium]
MRFLKTLSMLSLLLALCPLLANERSFEFASGESGVRLSNNDDYGFSLDISVNSYTLNELQTKGGLYEQILLEGFAPSNRIGEATLPMLSRIVAVPIGAAIKFRITNQEEIQIAAKDSGLRRQILPTQPPVSKSADYASLVFEKDHSFYARDAFSKNPLFWIEELGYLRGVRLFQFYYEPLRYNPVSGELKISTNTSIRVDFEHPDLAATEELLAKTASYEFETLYSKTIFNWNPNRATLVRNPTKILILCPPAYSSGMATYINFKRKQGYTVDLVSVGTNGTLANNATTIKNYLQNLWNNATTNNPAPTYLLIVGDHGTTGNNITSNTGQTNTSHITDLSYVRLNGTDYLPEMYYGRFSVSSTTELSNIVNKTLMFAQTSMPDLSYLGKTVMIAGVDANYASTHGNGAINYATTHYINSAHGITSNNYLYPASGSSASQIRANAAEGRAYMNYTAHGGATSWADPSFTAAQMTALTNTNKPFVAVGNCCITNQFNNSSPCFGEAIIRAPNAGAAYIGGTNNTYWNEDYYWAVGYKTPQAAAHAYDPSKLGVFDAMFHAPTNTADWASTTGETVFMGNMAVQQSGSSFRNYYWEIYSIMGDPSLMPYYGVPAVNNVSFPSVIMMNQSSITVSAAPYTRVALSFDGELSSSGIVPASGSLVLSFTPFSSIGTADLVFSASGKITRQESIQILPATGAYLSVEALEYRDNNNNLPDYNESGTLRVTFKNTGSSTASNITATLSCNNPGINITDGSETIANLVAGGSVTRNSAFAFNIADNVVNGTEADFTITMSSGSNNWEHTFSLSFNAPELSFAQNIVIHDANANNNGRLDPGESVSLSITLHNTGNAASPAGIASLSCTNTGISIGGSPLNFASIPAGASTSLYFDISASSSMSIGEIAQLVFNASAGAYSASKSEAISVGLIFEGFETGNFSSFPWVLEGSPAWTIDSNQRHSGSYSAKTGSIGHSSSTTLKINRVLTAPGTLSFWYKVSCEAGYDKLAFYIDGTLQVGFNGEVDWTQVFFPLAAGNRELKWVYQKDSSVSSGSDCAWIDDIIFPPSTNPSPFAAPQNLGGIPANRKISLSWSAPASGNPTSYKVFRAGNHIATVNSLSYEDNNLTNGTVYTYYVTALYAGGESDPSNFINVVAGVPLEFIIGNGTASTSSTSGAPINIYYKSLHGQSIYTAQELNAVGLVGPAEISALGFYIETAPDYVLPDFRLRMRHTTSSNVSSWQSAAGLQIYYDADYMPIEGGFDMISLDPPFVWNGVDNILVDTAFGLVQSWSTSGTVRYTESASGYRFVRNDNTPQHQYFSGGSVSNTKPNIKLHIIAPQIDGAHIEVNPGSLDFGEIAVGQEATLPFVVENQGNLLMNCRITTPAGYSVHPQ